MQTGYFIVLLVGFAWLALWSARPKPPNSKGWWPFDMRMDLDSPAKAPAEAMPGRWRGRPGSGHGAPPPAGPMPDAMLGPGPGPVLAPRPGPATGQPTWRQRRDQAGPGSRRPGR